MRIVIGSDHAGFLLKARVCAFLLETGHEFVDSGGSAGPVDYPDIAEDVSLLVMRGGAERGILICGSGVGASVAACKIPGVRAAVCHDTYSARQGVEHDVMNVLVLGEGVVGVGLAKELRRAFLGRGAASTPH